jgi:inosose dehydratase
MDPLMIDRLAAAPISWGICEAPGWGLQMTPQRVLSEMHALGIHCTELGALGWLPSDPNALAELLSQFELSVLGGFVPLVLHDPALHDQALADVAEAAETLSSAGATYFVTAIVSSHEAWERPAIDAAQWRTLFDHLEEIDLLLGVYGLRQVVHPHVNTLVETAAEFQRFVDNTPCNFCLDTGHLFVGGADPVAIAAEHHDRVGLVHIKDVDQRVAARLQSGELSLMRATQEGLFPAAGSGDVPIAATVQTLERAGYAGWYVLEQDVALLDGEPAPGDGPLHGVRQSIEYLKTLAV